MWRWSGGSRWRDEVDGHGADGLPRYLGQRGHQRAQFGDDGGSEDDE
jgi:hypothetical protein